MSRRCVKTLQIVRATRHVALSTITPKFVPDYAFEMASSSVRVGRGVSKEIGHDLIAMGLKDQVCVVTDKNLVNLPPFKIVADALKAAGVQFTVFDDVSVEPTDKSLEVAIAFAKKHNFKAFVAVGGGSVIDTAKAANVYMCNPSAEFLGMFLLVSLLCLNSLSFRFR